MLNVAVAYFGVPVPLNSAFACHVQGVDYSEPDSQYGSDTSAGPDNNGQVRKRRRVPLPSELYAPYLNPPDTYAQETAMAVPKRMRSNVREYNGWGPSAAPDASTSHRHAPQAMQCDR